MATLAEYEALVQQLERGEFPPSSVDGPAASNLLVGRICAGPWAMPAERSKAQALLYRIRLLKW